MQGASGRGLSDFAFRCGDSVLFFLGLMIVVVYCIFVHTFVLSIEALRRLGHVLVNHYLEVLPHDDLDHESDAMDRPAT